jgi:pyruvate/2-oxoglutarate dehydrogenase complex dihydrolipoamide dehydrogenase (E3) component
MGHQVTLLEKEKTLGGHMVESTKQEFKAGEAELFKWLTGQLKKTGVKILLNTLATPAIITSEKPDFLILAVGSEYMRPAITGAERAFMAGDILENISLAGEKVIVVGGGLVGAETALTLALSGRNVTLLEMTGQIAQKHESGARESLVQLLQRKKVCILTSHTVLEIGAGYIVAKDSVGVAHKIYADTVVLATGLISRNNKELQDIVPKTVCIGDCKEARKIYQCMHEAWNAVVSTLSDD